MEFIQIAFGVLLGAVISYAPRFIRARSKIDTNRAFLLVEIAKNKKMAETYLNDGIASPSYRLPHLGLSQCVPQIIEHGKLLTGQIDAIQDFYIEVGSLNRGLDQADKRRDEPNDLAVEVNRNRIKAQNILDKYEDAMRATTSISTWPWSS
jgi:hypothetical protein